MQAVPNKHSNTLTARAHTIKWRTLENLDKLLNQFEVNFTHGGGKVIYALTLYDAEQELLKLLQYYKVKTVLNRTAHTITAAVGGSGAAEVPYSTLLQHNTVLPNGNHMALADAAISDASALIASSGSISLWDMTGQTTLAALSCRLHIAFAGIDQVLPGPADAQLFEHITAQSKENFAHYSYNTTISAPLSPAHALYVIIVDNNRSTVLADADSRQSLYCIQCNRCLAVCPVQAHLAQGEAGPLSAIYNAADASAAEVSKLSHKSTLCAECTAVCPVGINIHDVLLHNRRTAAAPRPFSAWQIWLQAMRSRSLLNMLSAGIKNRIFKYLIPARWLKSHTLISFAPKSFSSRWLAKQKEDEKQQLSSHKLKKK